MRACVRACIYVCMYVCQPAEKSKNITPIVQANCHQVRPSTHHLAVFVFLLHSKA